MIRSSSPSRFVCFSWSAGLKNYSGYIASHNPDNNKIIVPFRSGNNGNFLGWYDVNGKNADAVPVVSGIYETGRNHFVMNGELGFTAPGNKGMGSGDRTDNNSILTSRLYTLYSDRRRDVRASDVVDRRNVNYYTNVDAAMTRTMKRKTISITDKLPQGWNGTIVPDPDGVYYLLASNFKGTTLAELDGISIDGMAPVFSVDTKITDNASSATIKEQQNNSLADELRVFVKGTKLTAIQDPKDSSVAYITNNAGRKSAPEVTIISNGKPISGKVKIPARKTAKVYLQDGDIKSQIL